MTQKQLAFSELLRNADKVIKVGKLEEAMCYINIVFESDAHNIYAKAYKERIISLMEAQGKSRSEAVRIATEAKFSTEQSNLLSSEVKNEKKDIPPEPIYAPSKEKTSQKIADAVRSAEPKIVKQTEPAVVKTQQPIKRTAVAQDAYRSLLLEIWKDGSISDEEQQRINSMRETFAITIEEHQKIEHDVRITAYMNAIRDSWKKGMTHFEPLKKKFLIQDQDQAALEPKIFQLLQSLQSNGSVLVLDDDEAFLKVMRNILHDKGFYCFTAVSGEGALQLLDTMTPDIVICDINFQKPHMSGFAFYEKFRSFDKYLTTPFIFLSALDQEVLIRTGKKLGADDYLTKPFDVEMLIATVEGKIRRSRELRRSYD